jgi:preprotein translocase subunit Sec61beta
MLMMIQQWEEEENKKLVSLDIPKNLVVAGLVVIVVVRSSLRFH